MTILRLEQTEYGYGGKPIVRCDALEIERGDVVGLVGENGSGKSTLLKGVVGLAERLGGRALLWGKPLNELRTSERVGAGMAFHPQGGKVFELLSVRDNLRVGHDRRTGTASEPFGERVSSLVADLPRLAGILDRPGRFLSGGERQVTGLARCILQSPDLMLLDEPRAALDPANEKALVSLLRRLSEEHGTALLIAEHDHEFLARVGATVLRVQAGKMEEEA